MSDGNGKNSRKKKKERNKTPLDLIKCFPPALSGESQFFASTCQRGNLSEGEKAIYTGIKYTAESASDVVSIGFLLLGKTARDEGRRRKGGRGTDVEEAAAPRRLI